MTSPTPTASPHTVHTAKAAHPVVFLVLILPFGVMSGYLTVALAYLLKQAGLDVAHIAGLVALSYLPHTWKFLWAPIADTTLTRKTWYLLAGALSALGILATGIVPATAASLRLLTVVILVSNVAVTFLAMSVESLMAYDTAKDEKGRAGGWFQAGNLGGVGLGGGAGLWMAGNLPAPWMAAAILGGACALCALALRFVAEPPPLPRSGSYWRSLGDVAIDLWRVARSRTGFLALLICFLPIGTGAAAGLWSAVAGDWNASANTVAVVTGVLGGIVSAIGCVVGGYICDRIDRKTSYALYGILQALCAVAMALAPRTEAMYVLFTLIYAFVTGLTYAGFTAVVLEAIGHGAAATKYSLYASLSNMPIAYMTLIDGNAHELWGAGGMLYSEAGVAIVGVLLFAAVAAGSRRRVPRETEPSLGT